MLVATTQSPDLEMGEERGREGEGREGITDDLVTEMKTQEYFYTLKTLLLLIQFLINI